MGDISKEDVVIADSKINHAGMDDNAVNKEVEKELKSYSLNPSQNTKSQVLKDIKDGNYDYNVIGNRGADSKHNFKKEATSPTNTDIFSTSPQVGGTRSQTVLENISDIKMRDGKRIAVGTIITKNQSRSTDIPEYYRKNGFNGDKLSSDEIKELNKKGYNLDESTDEKYYRVPVEIELGAAEAPKNERDLIKR